ncbi:MAG: endolytic transglycosylase MltG [Patescibacteria group bacterium]
MHPREVQSNNLFRRYHLPTLGAIFGGIIICTATLWYIYKLPYSPPGITSLDTYIQIAPGSTASGVAEQLETQGVIRDAGLFIILLRAQNLTGEIKSGTYYFNDPESLDTIIDRITSGRYGLPTIKITLPEGQANYQYANLLAERLEYISASRFRTLAAPYEGYLFPDTYFFPKRSTAQELIDIMRAQFDKQITPLAGEIEASPYTLDEIVIMASLVESEAGSASYATKQRVAGVLWRRIKEGMPLQADAVFSYIYQMHLPRVLYRHLEVDSPYNVYKNGGLPPGPIGNPGIDSIKATLDPIDEGYRYYLTGNDGTFHFAKTLVKHEQNRSLYLQY